MPETYYDKNGEAYFDQSVGVEIADVRARFTVLLPPGGAVCDAGCGSGRDAKAFAAQGFAVTAFDASPALVKIATTFTGIPVRHLSFLDMDYHQAFDGIWACASLLHVPSTQEEFVYRRFIDALKPGGVWYLSYKHGHGEHQDGDRTFTDHNEASLDRLLERFSELEKVDCWITLDRMGRGNQWVNVLVRKVPV